ncbi:MAG: hypothetical protein GX446_12580 [Chthonomonadales bacterium]|nr:hypothetical protein [Chthonomonadales bacterium]
MTLGRTSVLALSLLAALVAAMWDPQTPGLVNVALTSQGTRVVADTQYGDHVSGANAADGRIGHGTACWFSRDWTQLPCALTFEFRQPERLKRAVLYQAQWTGSMYHTKDFAIEVSNDGQTWRRVAAGALADDNSATTALDIDCETRWARVVVLTSYIPFQTCGFSEVEFLAERPAAVGSSELILNDSPAITSQDMGGSAFAFVHEGPQALVEAGSGEVVAELRTGESLAISADVAINDPSAVVGASVAATPASAVHSNEGRADLALLSLTVGDRRAEAAITQPDRPQSVHLETGAKGAARAVLTVRAGAPVLLRLGRLQVAIGDRVFTGSPPLSATDYGAGPPPATPDLRPAIQSELIRLDWMAQDGIGTPRLPVAFPQAIESVIERGKAIAARLHPDSPERRAALDAWRQAVRPTEGLGPEARGPEAYLRLREAKRALLLAEAAPLLGPIAFAKQVPACFSHQLTQYYGRYARPGGGLYVLPEPGRAMTARLLTASLPLGSVMHPEVSWDAKDILFAFCQTDSTPSNTIEGAHGRYYHLYRVATDGTGLRRLTDGPYNDFAPRYLPDGKIVFISTRRGGWHRCGTPGCENYVLTVADADGSRARPISYHETQEWDPAVLHDGRLVYTRWDYVDRHPVFYEQLWTTSPDGTRAAALFGNSTFNPVGIWEARPVPGSGKLMATAAAHHAMTAGSIILLDPSRGVDGLKPITRLTPDAPFPESETVVPSAWHAVMPGTEPYDTEENRRWPGHCYRSPYPLSERLFLAAYSFRELVGEPHANPANMFGIYLCDADGNKELLYRDPNIASLWPVPIKPRRKPPILPSVLASGSPSGKSVTGDDTGVFVLQDIYASLPRVPRGSVKALRIVQVLPKTTPGADRPPIGIPSGAPGKQVLGTVPVEADGSAHFVVPARKEVAFQALDERGIAVQIMRSGTYLQPGERTTCVGCHEPRVTSPPAARPLALRRPPSRIAPGPDGSKPFSYPIMVQSLLDQRCVSCHSGAKPAGGIVLTGEPEGHYTRSYNALARRVPFSDMGNGEAISKPGRFGAAGSPLMKMLLDGHQGVRLSRSEVERLATWMDVSVLFYGTFDPAEQERQRRGERIPGPKLE